MIFSKHMILIKKHIDLILPCLQVDGAFKSIHADNLSLFSPADKLAFIYYSILKELHEHHL